MIATKHDSANAVGHLACNWPESKNPALILNPKAQPLDLLAWCWGEIVSLESAVTVMSLNAEIDKGDMDAIILHRLLPLSSVMTAAMNELMRWQREGRIDDGGPDPDVGRQ